MMLFNENFVLTEQYLKKMFDSCNNMYFDNELIPIPVYIIDDETVNGYFKFDVDYENKLLKNPRIEISKKPVPYIMREKTMIHEMAHYKVFLDLSQEEINSAFNAHASGNMEDFYKILAMGDYGHNEKWKNVVETINNKYKLNVTVE